MKSLGTFFVIAMLLLSGCRPNSADRRGSGPPEDVEEETVVISDPEAAADIHRKREELNLLLRELKAYGAKMHGVIEFPSIDERIYIIHLHHDVK